MHDHDHILVVILLPPNMPNTAMLLLHPTGSQCHACNAPETRGMPAARLLLAELGLVTAAEALELEPVPASEAVPAGRLPVEPP